MRKAPLFGLLLVCTLLASCRKETRESETEHPFPDCTEGLGNPEDCPSAPPSSPDSLSSVLEPDLEPWSFARVGDSLVARTPSGSHRGLEVDEDSKDDPEEGCDAQSSAKPRSLVGGIASWFVSAGGYCPGAAHPWAVSTFHTMDLRTGEPADLRKIFPPRDLLAALRSDGVIRQLASGPLDSLAQIEELQDSTCVMGFGPEMWSNFAFHHLQGDSVAIRIGLSHACEVARGSFTQLGLLLPIPPSWKEPLRKAEAAGLLMKTLGKP